MRLTTVASIGIFAISAAAFAYSYTVTNNNLDTSGPVITMEDERIEISIHDGDDVILEGITAEDSKDGDVTASLVVENISNFIDTNLREASIVAFDSDNHITRTTREIVYTDYTSPTFDLSQPLRFDQDQYEFLTNVTAEDCIDGDITPKIHMTFGEEYTSGKTGDVKIEMTVSNSMGDVSHLPVTMTIYDAEEERNNPRIELTDYLVYAKSGSKFDAASYVKTVYTNGKTYSNKNGKLIVSNRYNTSDEVEELDEDALIIDDPVRKTPGVYEVSYTVIDSGDVDDSTDDLSTTIRLIVIVTPKEG